MRLVKCFKAKYNKNAVNSLVVVALHDHNNS